MANKFDWLIDWLIDWQTEICYIYNILYWIIPYLKAAMGRLNGPPHEASLPSSSNRDFVPKQLWFTQAYIDGVRRRKRRKWDC